MKFLLSAFVLMLTLQGCSTDNTRESVVTTGDVEVEDVQTDTVEEPAVLDTVEEPTVSDIVVDSTEDVTTVEEGD